MRRISQVCLFLSALLVYKISFGSANTSALLIIDVQNCFLKGGSLAVPNGEEVIPVINSIRSQFDVVVLTQDWHCPDHVSFASQHNGKNPFETIGLEYDESGKLCENCSPDQVKHKLNQTLWPDHCVMNTNGAKIKESVSVKDSDIDIRKGFNCEVDSYSAFFDNGEFSKTELDAKLKEKDVQRVFVSGLALDFCVYFSAKDAKKLDYETYVIKDATRGISPDGMTNALQDMKTSGIKIINSDEVTDILRQGNAVSNTSNYILIILLLIVSVVY